MDPLKMDNLLEHRGYFGSVAFSAEDNCLIGKVLFINDNLNFDGESIEQIKTNFQATIDDYLAFCERRGVVPDQPCKGTFNVWVGEEIHRAAAVAAARARINLNEFVKVSIQEKLDSVAKKRSRSDQLPRNPSAPGISVKPR